MPTVDIAVSHKTKPTAAISLEAQGIHSTFIIVPQLSSVLILFRKETMGTDATSNNVGLVAACTVGFASGLAAGVFFTRKKPAILSRPKYTPGQKPQLPSATFGKSIEVFNPSSLASSYHLMISSVTPRPIALVSSRSKQDDDGKVVDNVAPFSYFGCVGHDPPMLAIGFCRKGRDKVMKDSLANVLARKEFCVNIISEWYLDAANHSCGMFPPDVDEFDVSGLTKVEDCLEVNAPRVKEAAVTYECKLEHCYPMANEKTGLPTTEIVLARVVRVHVDHDVLKNGYDPTKPEVDTNKLKPVGRLGGNIYSMLGAQVDIPRPQQDPETLKLREGK